MKTKLIHEVRAVKNKKELENIIKAQRISEQVLKDTLKQLRVGVTELEIASYIKKSFIKYKAPILAFSPIVSYGKNTANIHHEPSKSKLKKGDTIMFDIGCTFNHYCSDMTRTYFYGQPNRKQVKMYQAVLKAQKLSLEKIEKGERRAKIIDKTARKILGKNFSHGLGHGVGTVIHEWPNFKKNSEDIIPTGCVMTVEPGLYLKGSRRGGQVGGVRIEDMIFITKKGYKNLTKIPKELQDVILSI